MRSPKAQKVLSYFETIAPSYDALNSLLSFGLHHLWKQAAVRSAELPPGSTVLDVCGGTADLAIRAAKHMGRTGRIIVYDFSPSMMRAGRQKLAAHGVTAMISPVCGRAESIAMRNNACDAALIGFGLRNLADMQQGLAEMHRVLKPGGRLVCLEFSRPVNSLLRRLYDMYSTHVIPLVGQALAGSREAYAYLPESIRSFCLPDQLSALMQQAGFSRVCCRRLSGGIAAIHSGVKRGDA